MGFKIDKLLFFDIETVSQYEELKELPEEKQKIWYSYKTNMEKRVTDPSRLPTVKNVDDSYEYWQEVYRQTAAFFPEFGKIACISMAFVNKDGKVKFESFYGEDEVDILKQTRNVFNKVDGLGFELCGHNIKGFDIPFMGKRYFINGLKPPKMFPSHDTKPWELKLVDTKDVWQFGNNWSLGSLDLVCSVLDVESPKNGDVKGDSVTTNFWEGKHEEIKEYCEKDVNALVDIIKKLNDLE